MKPAYNSMQALDNAIKIHQLEAKIAEKRLEQHWRQMTQGVKQEATMPKMLWGAVRNGGALGIVRSGVLGSLASTVIELVARKWLFKK